jgi:Baseplate J-like protein
MAQIKTFSQLVQSSIDNIKLRQPALDTKAGTVSRDLFIDNPSDQIATVYRDIQTIQRTQSILNSTGKILDQFGSNYNIIRDTGKRAAGTAILTFNSITNNIEISAGTTVTAKTGVVFRITVNIIVSAATKGIYSSFASSISEQLHIAGISDQYAVQVPIEALNIGINGNIPLYSLIKTSIPGVTNVTNITPTSGGTNPQGDAQYRNQILAGLSGSSAGTARGYKNALLAVSGIRSVFIATPGSPILTRDGTVTERNSDGSLIVLSPGIGGKIDIWIQGTDLINITESYVFHDNSGVGDITSTLNSHILGQTISNTTNLTTLEKRQLYTENGQLPLQPVDSIISLSGSVSGANFVENVNYSLIKDTGPDTQNSAFALDNIKFLQNFISIVGESVAKGILNSVDGLTFSNIKTIDSVYQNIIISNDLASISASDHTKITITHHPLTTVLRATNLTTGERYVISDQNLDTNTGLNQAGQVSISGSVLPSSQDLVQVDYIWDITYDAVTDYFAPNSNKFVNNAIDWGKSNYINMESALLVRNGSRYNLNLSRNIDRVFTAFCCDSQTTLVQDAVITSQNSSVKALRQITLSLGVGPVVYFVIPGIDLIANGIAINDTLHISSDTAATPRNGAYTIVAIVDRTTVQISPPSPVLIAESGNANIEIRNSNDSVIIISLTPIVGLSTVAADIDSIINVVSVKNISNGLELFTTEKGGSFSGNIVYLATDVVQPNIGDEVQVYFNSNEIFNISKNNGTINDNLIVLSTDDILDFNSVLQKLDNIFNNISAKALFVNYITRDVDVIDRTSISLMPFIGSSSASTLVDKNSILLTSRQPVEFDINNNIIRNGASYLTFILDGGLSSGGTIAVKGDGWFRIQTTLSVSQNNIDGLFDLSSIIVSNLGNVSTNYSVINVANINVNDGSDIKNLTLRGYAIRNNKYDLGRAIENDNLLNTEIDLSSIFLQNNIVSLSVGTSVDIIFYVLATNIAETIQFTTGRGTLYSKYKYSRVNRVELISGFFNISTSQIVGNIRIGKLSQPSSGSTYLANYSYFAPTEGETLTVVYRYNNIISDATNAIENVRTLTADVLTKLAIQIIVNVSSTIILSTQAINNSSQIKDQVISAVNNLIISTPMGNTLDYSNILRVITAISGISGADITVFDFVGSDFNGEANRKSLVADANQYFIPGTINITIGQR